MTPSRPGCPFPVTPHPRRMLTMLALVAALGACTAAVGSPTAAVAVPATPGAPQMLTYTGEIAPARRPRPGDWRDMKLVSLIDGAEGTLRVSAYGNGIRAREADGCTWTRAADWFSPSDSWAGCGDSKNWATGTAAVREVASIWPLRVGAEGRYVREATSAAGRKSTRETACKVVAARTVLREGHAPTPAYEVTCNDGRRTRTTWYAPDEGPIAFRITRQPESRLEAAWVRRK